MSEWKEKTLGDLLTLKRGYDLPEQLRKKGKVPIYSSSGISGFHSTSKVDPPGVVTGRYGSIGRVFLCTEPFWPLNTTLYVQDFKGSDEIFVYYFLQKINWHKFNDKSAVPGINRNDLHAETVLVPSVSEQRKIAAVLTCLDRKISNLRQQNETLEQIAQTLFKHWFVDFEFPNEAGEPYKSSGGEMVRSAIGEIPVGWHVGKLGDEFDILMGQSPAGSSYNEDGEGLIFFQGRTDFGFRFPQARLFTTEPKRTANKFDVLVSVRAPVGDINVAFEKCCIGRGLSTVSSKHKSYCLYKLKSYKKFFNVFESEGTVFGALNKQSFHDLESILPNENLTETFNSIVSPVDRKIFINEQEIQTLTKTRDLLLPQLMSGKLRITES